jgi:hypothetical protein
VNRNLAMAVMLAAPLACAAQVPPGPAAESPAASEPVRRAPGVQTDRRLETTGARIGKVLINRKNVFDTTLIEEDKPLFRLTNWLHIETRESTIRDKLLFQPGDRYDPRLLQESERLLRGTQFLHDAYILPVAYDDGLVDIEVSTQDVWTFQPGVSFGRKGGKNSSGFSLEETNLLGTGKELGIAKKSGNERDSKSLMYRDRQVGGSWWSLTTKYADNSDGSTKELELERPFYALDTRWSGGILVQDDRRVDSLYERGTVSNQFEIRDEQQMVYGGWSAGLRDGWVTRWTAGVSSAKHVADPITSGGLPGLPGQRVELVYPWLGVEWIEDDFQQTSNLDQIGKTEDIPFGWRTQLKFGHASTGLGSDRDAGIFDIKVSKGFQAPPNHTLLLTGTAKGRLEHGSATGALFGSTARYYYRRSPVHSFFMSASFDRGIHLDGTQQLLLGGDNGLRGYPLHYQGGTRRWLFTAEERTFTDWYLFQLFRVGGAVFFDMGRASGGAPGVAPAKGVLKDLGFGLRLGNSRTGFGNVIHIDVAFPLDGDKSISKTQLIIETKRSF